MNISTINNPNSDFLSLDQEKKATLTSLVLKMAALGVSVKYSNYIAGPLVETFFFKLGDNVPLAKILGKGEDLALSTNRESVVIIRDGDKIGIQLSRILRATVDFNTCLFKLALPIIQSRIPILLGQSYKGDYELLDLAEEPHALIAGSTGSGKSMFLLSTICTIAVSKRPEEFKMVIVDSKQVDLAICGELPHVIQVCRNALDLHSALDNLHNEMRRRNNLMKGIARNIDEYNQIQSSTGTGTKLPRILLIIDEFADLIEEDYLQAKANVEPFASFNRLGERLRYLAQLSRASGIHIIAATQRPSVKITGGDLKVNLPCRIAFKLTSHFDSRTILREAGAESLLGKGDMLVQSVARERTLRVHAPYVELDTLASIMMSAEGVRSTLIQVALSQAPEAQGKLT